MNNPFDVVNYEIQMFLATQILQKTKIESKGQNKLLVGFLRNALIESQILHIRVLTEIFMPGGKKDDSMIVAIAVANKARIIYSEDPGLRKFAKGFIETRDIPQIPRQLTLDQ